LLTAYQAVTGSGKTLSYVLPIIERLIRHETNTGRPLRKNEVFAIVVAPTRELAIQIWEVFEVFFAWLRREAEIAAAANEEQDTQDEEKETAGDGDEIQTSHVYPAPLLLVSGQKTSSSNPPPPSPIIVATPGRLSSYLSSTTPSPSLVVSSYAKSNRLLSLTSFDTLILDEADSLLSSPDHMRSMRAIWSVLPRLRRNWLFSATMMDVLKEDLGGIESAGLRNLVRVVVRVERKRKGEAEEQGLVKRRKEEETEAAKKADKERRTPVR
jgi:ATP-dependent RNA helicase DDX55/SPB4